MVIILVQSVKTNINLSFAGELYSWGMGNGGILGSGAEDDVCVPTLVKSKQLVDRKVFRVSVGGQHTVILAVTNNNNKTNGN